MSAEADAILVRVRDLLSDESRWHGDSDTRQADIAVGGALDADNEQVEADDPSAVRWCLIGALKKEAGFIGWPLPEAGHEAFERVIAAAGWPKGVCENDRDGYEVVITAVHRAIVDGRRVG